MGSYAHSNATKYAWFKGENKALTCISCCVCCLLSQDFPEKHGCSELHQWYIMPSVLIQKMFPGEQKWFSKVTWLIFHLNTILLTSSAFTPMSAKWVPEEIITVTEWVP